MPELPDSFPIEKVKEVFVSDGDTPTALVLRRADGDVILFDAPTRAEIGALGIPFGGTTGQVLAKATATDFDTTWVNQTGGGGGGIVNSVVPGAGISVNTTDPANPVVTAEVTQVELDAKASATDSRFPAGADIVNADISPTAAIAETKLALVSDGPAATPSRRTLGTGATQAAAGNDARLSDARTPTAHAVTHAAGGPDAVTLTQAQITNLGTDLAAKAPLVSPALAGIPTAPTAAAGTSTAQVATAEFVVSEVGSLNAGLPELRYGFAFSGGFADVRAIDAQQFIASGTWTKPEGTTRVLAILIGGGGGGSSGYRNVEGNLRPGGGGGAAGALVGIWIDPADLDATEEVTIGAGGAGGAALTANGVGNPGTAGGATIFDTIAGDIRALGGPGANHVSGLGPGFPGVGAISRGGYAPTAAIAPSLDAIARAGVAGGGGAGASRTAANGNMAGGDGGGTSAGAGGTAAATGGAGTAGSGGLPGSGGGGGNATGATGGWPGGAGGFPGGGGGGGSYGNADTPSNSGAGGAGAGGFALILSFR